MTPRARGERGFQFDVGTLWTMVRDTHHARCALIWRPYEWELRVSVDADVLLTERCRRQAQISSIASAWRSRLQASGWSPSTPPESETINAIEVRRARERRPIPNRH